MLIAIISDIHDNIANLNKCLNWCRDNGVEQIITCGDMTNLDTMRYLSAGFSGDIFLVAGNMELYNESDLSEFKNIKYSGEIGLRDIGGLTIGFCHEPQKTKRVMELALSAPNFIFYGHTHKPWLEHEGETIIVNPGNLAGVFHQATFAVLNTANKKLDLKIVADLK